ncbi:oxidoreductase [Aspergillus taichungensis]|uniref:Oxidoreductase n=1 Tax=Aspergillus taichungensis TaxID=482145 RepID=A0A2J5HWU3_9EURO|nr:oxidoreductase [Aspergillus taichungensis]
MINLPTALITGCSDGGIGSSLAKAFQARGVHVFATARKLSKMTGLEGLPNVTRLELDVESPSSVAAAKETVIAATSGDGRLNYLVNNSGVSINFPAVETDINDARKLFDVNFWGVVSVTNAFLPLLIPCNGTIINNASIGGAMYLPWGSFYSASKAAMRTYSETLRLELAPLGVKVTTVMTGLVTSQIFENTQQRHLAETSYYTPAAAEIASLASGHTVMPHAMSTAVYAQRVVDDAIGGRSGVRWRGNMASVAWLFSWLSPTWLMDLALLSTSGLKHMMK